MEWTKEKPNKPGWYWMKRNSSLKSSNIEISVQQVRLYAGKLCIMNWEIPNNVEWSGPIPEPK